MLNRYGQVVETKKWVLKFSILNSCCDLRAHCWVDAFIYSHTNVQEIVANVHDRNLTLNMVNLLICCMAWAQLFDSARIYALAFTHWIVMNNRGIIAFFELWIYRVLAAYFDHLIISVYEIFQDFRSGNIKINVSQWQGTLRNDFLFCKLRNWELCRSEQGKSSVQIEISRIIVHFRNCETDIERSMSLVSIKFGLKG